MPKELALVAMSGGVDSSVAAALLQKEGYEVIGATMRLVGDPDESPELYDRKSKDVADAQSVAEKLGVRFVVLDYRETFLKEIIIPYAEAYVRGLTPNPCAVCNRKIKFGLLMDEARKLGAKYLATGHYARIVEKDGRKMVSKGFDPQKDQSYFLFSLTHDDLENVLFPLGEMTKHNVRIIAQEIGLKTAGKTESNEACFVPGDDYIPVVEKYASNVPAGGEIVLGDGRVVGRHKGSHHFTVMQRRGLNVAFGKPMYVLDVDAETQRITIGGVEECRSAGLVAKDVVWNYNEAARDGMEIEVRIRYRTKAVKARIFPESESKIRLEFAEDKPLVTPGQAAVFYLEDVVIGGGWIERSLR